VPDRELKPDLIASPQGAAKPAPSPSTRAATPDDGVPRRVQIEINASETAEAGWPQQFETRHFFVIGSEVRLCTAIGKVKGEYSRQNITPGAEPEAIARSLWEKRLGTRAGDWDMPAALFARKTSGPIV
jgi:hypothetical protein